MATFVSRLSNVLAANDEYQEKLATHVERIKSTEDVVELNRILESLLDETRSAQADNRRAHLTSWSRNATPPSQAEARINQLEAQLAEMSSLVREDPLTHSLNRRGLDDEFAREASRADRYNAPFCLAVLDIDNFKALNDKRGHQTGDEALIHLVKIAREELRLTDHIARMGGEEFLIIMPNTPQSTKPPKSSPACSAASPRNTSSTTTRKCSSPSAPASPSARRAKRRKPASAVPTPPCTRPSKPARTACCVAPAVTEAPAEAG
jgi:diguanylate cyclase (GGDEF)-like protein